jgi:hypothetical protein
MRHICPRVLSWTDTWGRGLGLGVAAMLLSSLAGYGGSGTFPLGVSGRMPGTVIRRWSPAGHGLFSTKRSWLIRFGMSLAL